jgi:hypothetical protein
MTSLLAMWKERQEAEEMKERDRLMREHKRGWRPFKITTVVMEILLIASIFGEGFFILKHANNPMLAPAHVVKAEPISTSILTSLDTPTPQFSGFTWQAGVWFLLFAVFSYVIGHYAASLAAKRWPCFDLPSAIEAMHEERAAIEARATGRSGAR